MTGIGAITSDGLLTVSLAGNTALLTNTTDNASVQTAILQGDRATMADNDEAYLTLQLSNDAGTQTEFARLTWVATDVNAATSVDGRLDFGVVTAGTFADELQIDGAALEGRQFVYPQSCGKQQLQDCAIAQRIAEGGHAALSPDAGSGSLQPRCQLATAA